MRFNLSAVLPVFLLFIPLTVYADIVITKDEMILNGKIIEDNKPVNIIFSNNHGTFTIKYSLIKEIYKTESFQADIKIFREMGKAYNEEDVKKNYNAGMDKIEKQDDAVTDNKNLCSIVLEFYGSRNFGELTGVLPYSAGADLSGELPLNAPEFLKKYYFYGLDLETGWFYSAKADRKTDGFYASAGPLWSIPVKIAGLSFNFNISTMTGIGRYTVVNDEIGIEDTAVKWNLTLHAGPVFRTGSFIISTQMNINYIHDSAAPMEGAGLILGAGVVF